MTKPLHPAQHLLCPTEPALSTPLPLYSTLPELALDHTRTPHSTKPPHPTELALTKALPPPQNLHAVGADSILIFNISNSRM
eukprot:3766486-Rhodomonas_salina.1